MTDKETILLQIKYEDLFPIYQEHSIKNIVFKIFENSIKKNEYLNQYINTEEKIKKVFSIFELKFYSFSKFKLYTSIRKRKNIYGNINRKYNKLQYFR